MNPVKINEEKNRVLHLGRKNPMHRYMLGDTQLGSRLTEKDLGVLVATKLNISQQCALATKKTKVPWAELRGVLPTVQEW